MLSLVSDLRQKMVSPTSSLFCLCVSLFIYSFYPGESTGPS
jgi:hypothetical protein